LTTCALACDTNAGATTAVGSTEFDAEDGGPVPIALVALTLKV